MCMTGDSNNDTQSILIYHLFFVTVNNVCKMALHSQHEGL